MTEALSGRCTDYYVAGSLLYANHFWWSTCTIHKEAETYSPYGGQNSIVYIRESTGPMAFKFMYPT